MASRIRRSSLLVPGMLCVASAAFLLVPGFLVSGNTPKPAEAHSLAFQPAPTTPAPGPVPAGPSVIDGRFTRDWGGRNTSVFAFSSGPFGAAWITQDGGRIIATSNGGTTWVLQDTPVEARELLQEVHMGGPFGREGWAVGFGGRVLRTTNGGVGGWNATNASPVKVDPLNDMHGAELRDVYFLDSDFDVGWIVGDQILRKSVDSGDDFDQETITLVDGMSNATVWTTSLGELPTDFTFLGMDFREFSGGTYVGIAVGIRRGGANANGVIFRTNERPTEGDAGRKWQLVFDGSYADLVPGGCPTCCNSHVASYGPEIWDVDFVRSASTTASNTTVLACGGVGNNCVGYLFASYDGGATWGQEFPECIDATVQVPPTDCSTHLCMPDRPTYKTPQVLLNDIAAVKDDCPTTEGHCYNCSAVFGIAAFPSGKAVAVDYLGGVVKRDILTPQPPLPDPTLNVWEKRDYESYVAARDANTAVPWPTARTYDVDAPNATAAGTAYAVGQYDLIQKTTSKGDFWEVQGGFQPWRGTRDVFADPDDPDVAWVANQHYRVAKRNFDDVNHPGLWLAANENFPKGKPLNAIKFLEDGSYGVAVGTVRDKTIACDSPKRYPRIFMSLDQDTGEVWGRCPTPNDALSSGDCFNPEKIWGTLPSIPDAALGKDLFDLEPVSSGDPLDPSTEVWAVGESDLILYWDGELLDCPPTLTVDPDPQACPPLLHDGDWKIVCPPSSSQCNSPAAAIGDILATTFIEPISGFIVRRVNTVPEPTFEVWRFRSFSPLSCSSGPCDVDWLGPIEILDGSGTAAADVASLTDVSAYSGSEAFLVGSINDTPRDRAALFAYDLTKGSTGFGAFVEVTGLPVVDFCYNNSDGVIGGEYQSVEVLRKEPGEFEVFVGGTCGSVLWYESNAAVWCELRSRTSISITSLSMRYDPLPGTGEPTVTGYACGSLGGTSIILRYANL